MFRVTLVPVTASISIVTHWIFFSSTTCAGAVPLPE